MEAKLLIYSLIIFLAAFLGGAITLIRKWSDELLHIFISFGAGIFLGTVFLHLLPEAFSVEHKAETAAFILVGFMLVFFLERFLFLNKKKGYDTSHKVISLTALLGLSVHSVIAGIGLSVGSEYKGLDEMIFYSIISHKTTAAFALTSLFLLARISLKRCLLYLTLFSLTTPLGVIVFAPMLPTANGHVIDILLGLTAGTFLYVSVGEMLPEVFHTDKHKWFKLILLLIGIIIIGLMGDKGH